MKRTSLLLCLLLTILGGLVRTASAQWTVYDPADVYQNTENYWQLYSANATLLNEYQQAVQQYQMLQSQIQQLANLQAKYQQQLTPWTTATTATPDAGQTSTTSSGMQDWTTTLQGTGTTAQAATATQDVLVPLAPVQAGQAGTGTSDDSTTAARAQLQAASIQDALQAAGTARADGQNLDQSLQNLQADTLSTAPQDNTQTALLQKQTVSGLIIAKSLANLEKMSAAELELLSTIAARMHDEDAQSLAQKANYAATVTQSEQVLTGNGDIGDAYVQALTPANP